MEDYQTLHKEDNDISLLPIRVFFVFIKSVKKKKTKVGWNTLYGELESFIACTCFSKFTIGAHSSELDRFAKMYEKH